MKTAIIFLILAGGLMAADWTPIGQFESSKKVQTGYFDKDSTRFYESSCTSTLFGKYSASCHYASVEVKFVERSGAYRTIEIAIEQERACSNISNSKRYDRTGKFKGSDLGGFQSCLPDISGSLGYILYGRLFGQPTPISPEDLKCRADAIRIYPEYELGKRGGAAINTLETHYNRQDQRCYMRFDGALATDIGSASVAKLISVNRDAELANCIKVERNGPWRCGDLRNNRDIDFGRFTEITQEYLLPQRHLSMTQRQAPPTCSLAYRPADPADPDDAPRPQLPFTIEYGPRSFSGIGLVDSGADGVVFPLSYARALGIDLEKAPRGLIQGVTGAARGYHAEVTLDLKLCGQEFRYSVNAAFTDGIEGQGIGLLGQTGFLDHFQVVFNKTEGVFAVKPIR